MRKRIAVYARVVYLLFFPLMGLGQNNAPQAVLQLPANYTSQIIASSNNLTQRLEKKSATALAQLQKQEEKIKRKLARKDSMAAITIFQNAPEQYKRLEEKLKTPAKLTQYLPHLDSLTTSLNFLKQSPATLFPQVKEAKEKLTTALSKVKELENQFQRAETIKKFLKERKQFLKEQLSKFGFVKELKKVNKQVYYYAAQIKEYKDILKDPKKIEKKALELLSKTKLFKDFFRKNSMLASLFLLPGDPADPAMQASLAGLQTRIQVNGLIQQQIAGGGSNAQQQFQQNLQAAQSQLNELKNKVFKAGGGSSDAELPDFKPNNQKTKTFLQRLEYGANVQSQKASSFFPTTSDIGLSVGYKLNDKSIIGIGASYKMGWGRGWDHIAITHQGVGLRSYVDIKLKGSFWLSGGYEQNYKAAFRDFIPLQDKSGWQQSGLLGISKVVSLKTKLFKKTSIRLLWDFLSYEQVPRTQPVVFRIGYNF